jgi:hypothetical protein
MKEKLISLCLTFVMVLSLCPAAMAVDTDAPVLIYNLTGETVTDSEKTESTLDGSINKITVDPDDVIQVNCQITVPSEEAAQISMLQINVWYDNTRFELLTDESENKVVSVDSDKYNVYSTHDSGGESYVLVESTIGSMLNKTVTLDSGSTTIATFRLKLKDQGDTSTPSTISATYRPQAAQFNYDPYEIVTQDLEVSFNQPVDNTPDPGNGNSGSGSGGGRGSGSSTPTADPSIPISDASIAGPADRLEALQNAAECDLTAASCPAYPYEDLDISQWYHTGIHYCLEMGRMVGVDENIFAPFNTLTRGMLVTILYQMDSKPDVTGSSAFEDVADGVWYSDAITWAEQNDIVAGFSETEFAPNQVITREQMAAIMYRYALYKGYDLSITNDLSAYDDADAVSSWAVTAVEWAVSHGLISGRTATTLVPQGETTRAEAATIIYSFDLNIV